jgi:hypothetical protein
MDVEAGGLEIAADGEGRLRGQRPLLGQASQRGEGARYRHGLLRQGRSTRRAAQSDGPGALARGHSVTFREPRAALNRWRVEELSGLNAVTGPANSPPQ